ncbi:MAG: hypothetical protein L0312_20175 [Acidobacteria bacterium]|nr:hypothetical protein [Acidobacteriota bacterium]
MKRKIVIRNQTCWRTDHIRRFIVKLAEEILPDKNTLHVTIVHRADRGRRSGVGIVRGCAGINSRWFKLRLTKHKVDPVYLAHTIARDRRQLSSILVVLPIRRS